MFKLRFIISLLFCLATYSLFAQPLDYFLSKGLNNSPLLKDLQNQVSMATVDSIMIRANRKPQVNLNAIAMKAPFGNNFGYDDAITNGGTYSSTFGVSQNIFGRKILENKYEGVAIQKKSLQNTFKLSTNDLRKAITNQYLTSLADYNDLEFNKNFFKLVGNEKDILKTLVEHGVYKQTDYLAFAIEAQNQQLLINQLSFQFQKDVRLLKIICGINDTSKISLIEPVIENNSELFNVEKSLLMQQFKIDSLKILNDKAAVDMRYKPKLNWIADAGLISATPANLYQHFGFSFGVGFTMPIYDGKQRHLDYQKLSITEQTRTNYKNFNTNQISGQYIQLKEELQSLDEYDKLLNVQVKTAEDLITLSKAQLNAGNMLVTDLISALKNYNNIYHNLNQLKIAKLQVMNELEYLLQQ